MIVLVIIITLSGCDTPDITQEEISFDLTSIDVEVKSKPTYDMVKVRNDDGELLDCEIDSRGVRMFRLGSYKATCKYKEEIFSFKVNVVDTTMPSIEVQGELSGTGHPDLEELSKQVSCIDGYDDHCDVVLIEPDSQFDKIGTHFISFKARDSSGNENVGVLRYHLYSYETPSITTTVINTTQSSIEINYSFDEEIDDSLMFNYIKVFFSVDGKVVSTKRARFIGDYMLFEDLDSNTNYDIEVVSFFEVERFGKSVSVISHLNVTTE